MSPDKTISAVTNYFIRIGDAVSQLLNVVVFFGSNPNESISGRCYRQQGHAGWNLIRAIVDFVLTPFERDHCKKAWEADLSRAKALLEEQGV